MTLDVGGRTAVITGASRGLGAGLAAAFAARGLRLGLCARSRPELSGPEVLTEALDVRDVAAMDAFGTRVADRFGRIDLWINNAGVLDPVGPFRDQPADAVREHMEINVLGVLHGSRTYVTHVRARGSGGVLINVSSGAGRRAYFGWAAYCASKAAVDRFTECLALEEADAELRCYAVAPGVIETGMQERIRTCSEAEFPEVERFRELHQSGAMSRPEFVAEQLLGIAFDAASAPGDVLLRLPPDPGASDQPRSSDRAPATT